MSIAEVVAGLRGVLDLLTQARQRAAVAGVGWDQATAGYSTAVAGSTHSDSADLASLCGTAEQRIREANQLISRTESIVTDVVNRLSGDGVAVAAPQQSALSSERPLPRGLPGAKAEGRWRNGRGEDVVLRSGRDDEWWAEAERFARRIGLVDAASRAALDLSKHIEIKLAMRMREPRERCRRHEIVRIDRPVCGTLPHQAEWALTCDKMLPTYLPPGATLTVVEPDGTRRMYAGNEDTE